MAEDIQLFLSAGKCRGSNDSLNKKREPVLCILYSPPQEYLDHPEFGVHWKRISQEWKLCVDSLCDDLFDTVTFTPAGGRGKSYDVLIRYTWNGDLVKEVKGEFKHNSKSLKSLPQYFSKPESARYISACYAEYFYDTYLDQICNQSNLLIKPEKGLYLSKVYGTDYDRLPFFRTLKTIEPQLKKDSIVKESISKFLETHGSSISLLDVQSDIQETQRGKVFLLWDCKVFRADTLADDELELTEYVEIRNKNTIVLKSKAGTTHHLLLRWRNHGGILMPAWQISLKR